MDVQCERCKTEYEFDDALVSGRGTTVKCTNCGFQFKIKPPDAAAGNAAERWAVTTTSGTQLVFTTLRELQRAISNRQVGRGDTLSRGNAPPRVLGSIAELEPFFVSSDRPPAPPPQAAVGRPGSLSGAGAPPGASAISRDGTTAATAATFPRRSPSLDFDPQATQPSVGASPLAHTVGVTGGKTPAYPPAVPVPRAPFNAPPAAAPNAPPAAPGNAWQERPEELPPPREKLSTLRPPSDQPVPPPAPAAARLAPVQHHDPSTDASFGGAPTAIVPAATAMPAQAQAAQGFPGTSPYGAPAQPAPWPHNAPSPYAAPPPPAPRASPLDPELSSPLPPPTVPVRRGSASFDDEYSEQMRFPSSASMSDDNMYSIAPRRRRVGGWIVAAVLLGGVALIGYKIGQPYFAQLGQKGGAAPALDPRAAQFLTDGEHALGDGNLDLAKENFDKASALAESDPHVLLDVARLGAARADVPWLKLRLLPPDAVDDIKATQQSIDDLAGAARKAADAALAAAPEDPSATRAKIDALRIIGERDAARTYVTKIIANASQPETAYVLAALDLAELDPLWPTVIDRLRVAAAGEGNAGRARAALVYALARSGDAAGAKAELDKLSALTRPYPLVPPLRAYLTRAPGKTVDAGAADAGKANTLAAGTAAVDVNSLPRPSSGGDPRELLKRAAAAENRRDFDLANKLYEDMLHADPQSSEALGGLGSVALKQRNFDGAKSYFNRALSSNPNYMGALVGLADIQWDQGDKAGAIKKYKDIIERFPESSGYPSWVKTRAAESGGGGGGPSNTPASAGSGTLSLPGNTPSDLPSNP